MPTTANDADSLLNIGQKPVVIVEIHGPYQAPLFQMAEINRPPCLLAHPLQSRHEDGHENGNDGQ